LSDIVTNTPFTELDKQTLIKKVEKIVNYSKRILFLFVRLFKC